MPRFSLRRNKSAETPLNPADSSSMSPRSSSADYQSHDTAVPGTPPTIAEDTEHAPANDVVDIREHDDMIQATLHSIHAAHAQPKNLFGLSITKTPSGQVKIVITDEVRLGLWGVFVCMCIAVLIFLIVVAAEDDVEFSDTHTHPHGTSLIIAGIFALLACLITAHQIRMHVTHWTHPASQKLVIRILMMVPVYSISSWLALLELEYSTYIDFVRVAYEAFTLYTFMVLLTQYLGGHAGVVEWMQYKPPIKWIIPLNCLPQCAPTSNFLWYLKYACLQYAIFAPIGMLIAVICESTHTYGDGELNVNQGYLYVTILINTTQIISLYSLAWLYVIMKKELIPFNPVWKFLVIKSVVFFTFWQGVGLAILVKIGVITDSENFSVGQVQVGLQDFITCIEMFLAACAHKYTFGYETYSDGSMALLMEQRATFIAGLAYKRAVIMAQKELAEREKADAEKAKLAGADTTTTNNGINGIQSTSKTDTRTTTTATSTTSPDHRSASPNTEHSATSANSALNLPADVRVSELGQTEREEIIKNRVEQILRENAVAEHVLFDDRRMGIQLPVNTSEYEAQQDELHRRDPELMIEIENEEKREGIQMHQYPQKHNGTAPATTTTTTKASQPPQQTTKSTTTTGHISQPAPPATGGKKRETSKSRSKSDQQLDREHSLSGHGEDMHEDLLDQEIAES